MSEPKFPLIPIIDTHIHAQTLTWNDLEELAISNYKGMILIATNYHWAAHIPVPLEEVKFLWNYAVMWSKYAKKTHGIETYAAIAVHTLAKVSDADKLLEYLPSFIKENRSLVGAIGESGFEPTQYGGVSLSYDEQEKILRKQFETAHELELPIIIHTPVKKTAYQGAWDANLRIQRENWPAAKVESAKRAIELVKDLGVDQKLVVIDHSDDSIVDEVLFGSKANCAFSTAIVWRNVGAESISTFVRKYGDDRIIVNSDLVGNAFIDLHAVPRTVRNMIRLGIDPKSARRVVFDNPAKIFGFDVSNLDR